MKCERTSQPQSGESYFEYMMKKFELCYDIEPGTTFLVPDLLPKNDPFTGG